MPVKNLTATRGYELSLVFIGLMFFLPFINMYHRHPLPVFYSEWVAGLLGLVAVAMLLGSSAWRTASNSPISTIIKIPKVSLIFIGLAAILCTQWALGMLHSSQYALLALSYLTWAFLLVVVGSLLRRQLGLEQLVTVLASGLVAAGVVNIGIVVLQFVVRTGGAIAFLPHLSSYGALAQSNHFADFCALATASLIYLHAKQRFSSSLFYLMLLCFVVMLSFSGSRSVWLYLTAMTVLLAVMHYKAVQLGSSSSATHRAYRAGLLLLPAFVIVQMFIHYVVPNDLVSLPTERLVDGVTASSSSLRLHIWYDSFRMFLKSPWLGVGVGKFIVNTFLLMDSPTAMATKRIFEHAHNLFIHLLAEMGIAAVLIVFLGLFSWVKGFKWQSINLETCWLISLLAVLGIHSMLEYPLWFSFFLGIAAVLLGAGDEKFITVNFCKLTNQFSRIGLALILLLSTISLITMLIANVKLENWVHKLANEGVGGQSQLNWVEQYSLLSPFAELMRAMTMKINTNNLEEETMLNQSVMNFRPMRTVAYQYALLLQLNGQHADAVKQLSRTLLAYPDSFKDTLESAPADFRQEYLDLMSATRLKEQSVAK